MSSHKSRRPVASVDRIARVNELLKRGLADLLESLSMNEREGCLISVTRVHCSSSLTNATAYISVLGPTTPEKEQRIIRELISRKAELQSAIASEIILKYTPVLHFAIDKSVEQGDRVLDILRKMEEADDAGR